VNEKRLSESMPFSLEERGIGRNIKATFRSVKGHYREERKNLFSVSLLEAQKRSKFKPKQGIFVLEIMNIFRTA